jgi:quercetin dioxygenase-like cupin family protein
MKRRALELIKIAAAIVQARLSRPISWIMLSLRLERRAVANGDRNQCRSSGEKKMFKNPIKGMLIALVVAAFCSWAPSPATSVAAQQAAVTRKVLLQQDLAVPGYTAALVAVEIPVGGREGKHTHPGTLIAYVQEGVLSLDYEGKPTANYRSGDTFSVEPGKIHEGINNGTTPVKVLAAFVVEKGKPITSPSSRTGVE